MSENEEVVNALTGVGEEAKDYKALYEESQRELQESQKELQKNRVEFGRLKKTADELASEKEDNVELRKEIDELRSRRSRQELIESVPEDQRNELPEEVLNAAATMVEKSRMDMENRIRELEKRRTEANASESRAELNRRLSAKYGNVLRDIGPGGDKQSAWNEYLRFNKASVQIAVDNGDFDTVSYHIENFFRNTLGVPVPSGDRDGSAVPDPRASIGGAGDVAVTPGRTYTQSEFLALYDALENARDRGDGEAMRRISSEIEKAPTEGRVKNDS